MRRYRRLRDMVISSRDELLDARRRLRASELVRGTDHEQDDIRVSTGVERPRRDLG
jgi:hypothetical protein